VSATPLTAWDISPISKVFVGASQDMVVVCRLTVKMLAPSDGNVYSKRGRLNEECGRLKDDEKVKEVIEG